MENKTYLQERRTAPAGPSSLTLNTAHCLVLSFALAVLTPCFPKGSTLRHGILFLQIVTLVQGYRAPGPNGMDNVSALYTNGVLLANLTMRYFDRLYLQRPEDSFRKRRKDGSLQDPDKMSSWGKFLWSFELFAVTRGIGWNWQVRGIPKAGTAPKAKFLRSQMVRWIAMYAGLWLVSAASQQILEGFPQVRGHHTKGTLAQYTSNTVFLYLFIMSGWAITIYSHFAVMILPLSVICVGLNVGPEDWQEPDSWPPNFGSMKDAYSIRRFWGYGPIADFDVRTLLTTSSCRYAWHQQLRRITGTPGACILAHMPKSFQRSQGRIVRLMRRYSLLLFSFFVSGMIHASGSYTVTRLTHRPLSDGGEIAFFLLQGVAIAIEDTFSWALAIDDNQPPSKSRRWIGYSTTATWYIWTRVTLKYIPLASAMGVRDDRGELFAAVRLMRLGAEAVPGNFVAVSVRSLLGT